MGVRAREIWYVVAAVLSGLYAAACFSYGQQDDGAMVAVVSVGLPFAVATFLFLRGLRGTDGATERQRMLGMAAVVVGLLLAVTIGVSAWGRVPGARMVGVAPVHRTGHWRPGGMARLVISCGASSLVWTVALVQFLRSVGCRVRWRPAVGFFAVLLACVAGAGRLSEDAMGKWNREANLLTVTMVLTGVSAMFVVGLRRQMEVGRR